MNRRTSRALAIAICLALATVSPASAKGVEERGRCSIGPGVWKIAVRSEDGGKLRVQFRIEHVPAGQRWQVFLSDNGARIFSGTRRANSSGEVHVTVFPTDRSGTDRIAASAVNGGSGVVCEGSLAF